MAVVLMTLAFLAVWAPVLRHNSCIGACTSRRNDTKRAKAFKNAIRDSFILTLLTHPGVSGLAMKFFRCRSFVLADGNSTVDMLMADYGIPCYDDQWYSFRILVVIVLLVFSAGAPIFIVSILYKKRHILQEKKTRKQFGVFYKSYKPQLYFYEAIVMVFKLALWSSLCAFSWGDDRQLASAMAINVAQLCIHLQLQPYVEYDDDDDDEDDDEERISNDDKAASDSGGANGNKSLEGGSTRPSVQGSWVANPLAGDHSPSAAQTGTGSAAQAKKRSRASLILDYMQAILTRNVLQSVSLVLSTFINFAGLWSKTMTDIISLNQVAEDVLDPAMISRYKHQLDVLSWLLEFLTILALIIFAVALVVKLPRTWKRCAKRCSRLRCPCCRQRREQEMARVTELTNLEQSRG